MAGKGDARRPMLVDSDTFARRWDKAFATMKALILLPYYDRPRMVLNALHSVRDQEDDRWRLAVVDDGSEAPAQPIVTEVFGDDSRVRVYRCDDTREDKLAQGGSRHGEYMTRAVLECAAPEDVVVVCCDDDALVPDCVGNVLAWFEANPEMVWGYGHVREFDPTQGPPTDTRDSSLNRHTGAIQPACQVDGSQVCYRASVVHHDGVHYPAPLTATLDASSFEQIHKLHGACPFMGFVVQYKGVFPGQLGRRSDPFQAVDS